MWAKIGADAEAAPEELRPVFVYLRERLFDAELSPARLRERFRGPPADFHKSFTAAVGCSPRRYIRECRKTVIHALVVRSRLEVKAVALLTGVKASTVQRDYKNEKGTTPLRLRAGLAEPPPPLPEPRPLERLPVWHQVVAGAWAAESCPGGPKGRALGLAAALDLLAWLVERHPGVRRKVFGHGLAEGAGTVRIRHLLFSETHKAARTWRVARTEPGPEQRARVAFPIPFRSFLLYNLLSRKCREAAPPDAALGLARLALESLRACAGLAPREDLAAFEVRGQLQVARLALACGDCAEAAEALGRAQVTRDVYPGSRRGDLEAGLLETKALLRWQEHRAESAERLAGLAASLYRRHGDEAGAERCDGYRSQWLAGGADAGPESERSARPEEDREALGDRAAGPTMARIERAAGAAGLVQYRKLLETLQEELFSVELKIDTWIASSGLEYSTAVEALEGILKARLLAYVRDCRNDTAARLLHQSELSVEAVGELVGFSTKSRFIESFAAAYGLTPDEYRRLARRFPPSSTSTGFDMLSSELALRTMRGQLTGEEAWELFERVWSLLVAYCESQLSPSSAHEVSEAVGLRELEEDLAAELWRERLAGDGNPRLRELCRPFFSTSALDDLGPRFFDSRRSMLTMRTRL